MFSMEQMPRLPGLRVVQLNAYHLRGKVGEPMPCP